VEAVAVVVRPSLTSAHPATPARGAGKGSAAPDLLLCVQLESMDAIKSLIRCEG
jgi:hypothetical protein